MYLDLDELDAVFAGRLLWSTRRPALARFRRVDHLGDPNVPLATAVRQLVRQRACAEPSGPIRLLTHLRYFGYIFNPVSFYFCHVDQKHLATIVAEVNNTPWGEMHCLSARRHSESVRCRLSNQQAVPRLNIREGKRLGELEPSHHLDFWPARQE